MKKHVFLFLILIVSFSCYSQTPTQRIRTQLKVDLIPEIITADSVLVTNGTNILGYVPRAELQQQLTLSGTQITISGQNTIDIGPLVGANAIWGNITGTLSNQIDLQSSLDSKQENLTSGTNIRTINGLDILGSGNLVVSASGSGVSELSDLLDVSTSIPTNRFSLMANGTAFVSRALVEADISDLGSYVALTGMQSIGGIKIFQDQIEFYNGINLQSANGFIAFSAQFDFSTGGVSNRLFFDSGNDFSWKSADQTNGTGATFAQSNTAIRKYTFQDASGTVAFLSDIVGGTGDFLADGTVPMTGQIDMDSNNLSDVGILEILGSQTSVTFRFEGSNEFEISPLGGGSSDDFIYNYNTSRWEFLGDVDFKGALTANGTSISTDDQTATEVSYDNATSALIATNTQDAIDEVASLAGGAVNDFVTGGSLTGTDLTLTIPNQDNPVIDLSGLSGGTDDQTATEVPFTPNGSITSTNVQDAIIEVRDEAVTGSTGIVAEGFYTTTALAEHIVPHGLAYTPSLTKITVSGGSSINSPINVKSVDATNITFVVGSETVIAGIDFYWKIFGTGTIVGQTAAEVVFTPTGNTTSTNVQTAIVELQTELDGVSGGGGGNPNVALITSQSDLINTNNAGKIYYITQDFALTSDVIIPDSVTISSNGGGVIDVAGYKVLFQNCNWDMGTDERVFDFLYYTTRTYNYTATGGESIIDTGLDVEFYPHELQVDDVLLHEGSEHDYTWKYGKFTNTFEINFNGDYSTLDAGEEVKLIYTHDLDRSRIDPTSTFVNGDIDLYNFGMRDGGNIDLNTGTDNRNIIRQAQQIWNIAGGKGTLMRSGNYMYSPVFENEHEGEKPRGLFIEGFASFEMGQNTAIGFLHSDLDYSRLIVAFNTTNSYISGGRFDGYLETFPHDVYGTGSSGVGIRVRNGNHNLLLTSEVSNTTGDGVNFNGEVNFIHYNTVTADKFTIGSTIDASGVISADPLYSYSDLWDITNQKFADFGWMLGGSSYADDFGLDTQQFWAAYYDATDTFLFKTDMMETYRLNKVPENATQLRLIIYTPKVLYSAGFVQFLTGENGDSLDGITVQGVQIMSGPESFDTTMHVTAQNVVDNINAFISTPEYTAQLDRHGKVTIISDVVDASLTVNTTRTGLTVEESNVTTSGLRGTIYAPWHNSRITVSNAKIFRGKRQGLSNLSADSRITGVLFSEIGRGYDGINGVGTRGNPGWVIDLEDGYRNINHSEIDHNYFRISKGGFIILKGTRDISIHDNVFEYSTYPSFNVVSAIDLQNGEQTSFYNNLVKGVELGLGRNTEAFGNRMFDTKVTFQMEGSKFRDNSILYDVILSDSSTGQEYGFAYIQRNNFFYTKPLTNGNPIIRYAQGMILEDLVFDLNNVNIDEGILKVGDYDFRKEQGYFKNITIKNAHYSESAKGTGIGDLSTMDIYGFDSTVGLRISGGLVRDIKWNNINIVGGSIYGWFLGYPNTVVADVNDYKTWHITQTNVTIDDDGYLLGSRFMFETDKDVNIYWQGGSLNMKLGNDGDSNSFFDLKHNGWSTFKDVTFTSEVATTANLIGQPCARIYFVDCSFINVTMPLRAGDKFLYTKPHVDMEVYSDNIAALAGGIPVGYLYRTSTGQINTTF